MKKKNIVLTIFLVVFSISFFFGLSSYYEKPVSAEVGCPSNMEPNSTECWDYLNEQATKLKKNESSLQKKLQDEEYEQLNLVEKISYINSQIQDTQNNIKLLEIEIDAQNIEIKLLEEDIKKKEENISVLGQEISILEDSVSKRVVESYKYSFVGPLEMFLDTTNFSTVLRKTKYLAVTRTQDRNALEDFSVKVGELRKEEDTLSAQRAELQKKRNKVEEEKIELAIERSNLEDNKAEQSVLLAESARREAAYKADLKEISLATAEVTKKISDLANYLYETGQLGDGSEVWAGSYLGRQGHTGCSFGSHLHFEIRNSSGYRVNPLNGYLKYSGGYILSGIYTTPISGAYLTQDYSSAHPAIDMVSLTDGNQYLERYTVPYGICSIVDYYLDTRKSENRSDWNLAYLTGEGAIIRAVSPGTVYYNTDQYGGKYALVAHNDGSRSLYFHLQ